MHGASVNATPDHQRSPLRICFLVDTYDFLPPFVGGVGRFSNQLARGLVAKGHEVRVITRQREPGETSYRLIDGMWLQTLPPAGHVRGLGWSALLPVFGFHARVTSFLLRHRRRYDVVLVSGFRVLSVPAVVAAQLARRPCVVRLETNLELTEDLAADSVARLGLSGAPFATDAWRSIRNAVLRRANGFVTYTQEIAEGLQAQGFAAERIHVIPCATDVAEFRPASATDKRALRGYLGLPEDRIVFAYVGRLVEGKGVLTLLKAWRTLLESRRESIHLLILGSGGDYPHRCDEEVYDYVIQHEIVDRITLPGAVSNVADYLRAADIFVFPSEHEGFGLAFLEAMAAGLPTISTRVGGAPEAIEHEVSGYLVPPGDEAGLRRGMEWMLDHRDQWPDLASEGRRSVMERFSIPAVADLYVELFSALCRP